MGIMEKNMEATIVYLGYTRFILGLYRGYMGEWKRQWKLL